MGKIAVSADGVEHEFPDETPQAIIDRVMLEYAQSKNPPAAKPRTKPVAFDPMSLKPGDDRLDARPRAAPDVMDAAMKKWRTDPGLPGVKRSAAIAAFNEAEPPAEALPALKVSSLQMQDLAKGRRKKVSAAEAVGTYAARAVAPTAGAVGGGIAGIAAGGMMGPVAGIAAPVLGLAGAIGGGLGVDFGQEKIIERLPQSVKERLNQADWQLEQAAQEHPYASFAGSLAPGLVTGRPAMKFSKSVPEMLKSVKVVPTLGGLALGAGGEGAMEFVTDQPFDLGKIAMSGAAGALSTRNNRFGRMIYGTPESELNTVLRRKENRFDPALAVTRRDDLRAAGVKPVPLEVLDPTRGKNITQDAASLSPNNAADLIRKYAKDTPAALTSDVRTGVGHLVPDAPGQTGARLEADAVSDVEKLAAKNLETAIPLGKDLTPARMTELADSDVSAAAPPVTVAPGEGGVASQNKLTSDFKTSQAKFFKGYDDASNAGDAFIQKIDPEDPASVWQPTEGGYTNALTGETKSAAEIGPKNSEDIAKNVTKALVDKDIDFEDPLSASVKRMLVRIGDAKTAKDLMAIRRILSRKSRDASDPTERFFNKVARQALDGQLDDLQKAGRFVDEFGYTDSAPVKAWNDANDLRRQHATDFEGNDLLEELSSPAERSGASTTELDPDYVSKRVFGSGPNFRQGPNTSRDLEVIRGRLGADSPEWESLRKEGAQKVLGDDPAKAAEKLAKFEKTTPKDLVDMIITPEDRAIAAKAGEAVKGAEEVAVGLKTGKEFASMNPTDFADNLAALSGNKRALTSVAVATRDVLKAALAGPKASHEVLSALAKNETAQANLVKLLGKAEADRFVQSAKLHENVTRGLKTGSDFASMNSVDFADNLAALRADPRAMTATKVATRDALRGALSDPDSARSMLDKLAKDETAQANLGALLDPAEAARFIKSAKTLVRRADTAKDLDPGLIPGAPQPKGGQLAEGAVRTLGWSVGMTQAGYLFGKTMTWLRGHHMSDAQATQLVNDMLDPAKTDQTIDFIKKMYGETKGQALLGRLRAESAKNANEIRAITGAVTRTGSAWDTKPGRRKEPEPVVVEGPPEEPKDEGEPHAALDDATPLTTTIAAIKGVEGDGKNPKSSAEGLYQFTDPTFKATFRQLYPGRAKDMSDDQILAQRGTGVEEEMGPFLARQNAGMLKDAGFGTSPRNVYAMHFFGPAAIDVLKTAETAPNTPVVNLIGTDAIKANPYLEGKSVQEALDWAANFISRGLKVQGD